MLQRDLLQKMLQVETLHCTSICAQQLAKQKTLPHSPQSVQELSGKEHLPGGGHWKRGSCARACSSVQRMAPPAFAMAGVIPKDKRSKGPQKHRFEISRMYVFMFSIIWPIMLSTSNCSLVPHFPTIITPKRDARRIFHGEISEKC